MRVGVNTLFLIPGEVGGSETYSCETLSSITQGFPEVSLVLFTQNENDRVLRERFGSYRQVEFVKLGFNASNRYMRIVREQTELPWKAWKAGIDLLWSPGYTAPCICTCPRVTSILDMQYKNYPEDLSFIARITANVLVNIAARLSNAIIAISEFSKEEIVKHTGLLPDRVHVTPLAADTAFAGKLPDAKILERATSLSGGPMPYILLVSNTYPHKNVHLGIEAFGQIMDSIPHHLILVGQPRLGEAKVQKAIKLVADPGRIKRLHYVSREDLIALYQGAEVFMFPSLYEGFGLPVLEAMIAGVPVVTTRSASICEVGGENVVYFDNETPGDLAIKIRDVLTWTPDKRTDWTARARERAEEFTWQRTAAETIKVFQRAAEACHSRGAYYKRRNGS